MLSKRLESLHPYIPGEQPKDRDYIKLNANENPFPPHKSVVRAISKAAKNQRKKIALYPDPDSLLLRKEIAQMLNKSGAVLCNAKCEGKNCQPSKEDAFPFELTEENIFCGNGSDEVLSFVFYTFFDSDRPLILPEHTYSFYPVYCGYYNIPMQKIPLKNDWTLDKEKILEEANKNNSSIIFANPNAPTGLSLSRDQIKEMLSRAPKDKVFVVDEAYCDFGGQSAIPLLKDFDNLVIVRTFSKSMSFAGQRLGYIVSNPALIKSVFTVKNSFNHFPVDFLTQKAAIASCRAISYYAKNAKIVAAERDSLVDFLRNKGWFVIDSKTNFIFAKKEGTSGQKIYESVKEKGILIRHFNTAGIEDFVRITIGTKKENAALKAALENI